MKKWKRQDVLRAYHKETDWDSKYEPDEGVWKGRINSMCENSEEASRFEELKEIKGGKEFWEQERSERWDWWLMQEIYIFLP